MYRLKLVCTTMNNQIILFEIVKIKILISKVRFALNQLNI